jgi:hypothetical protein
MVFEKDGTSYQRKNGSRQDVWDAISFQTSSGLQKDMLVVNKRGRLVSKRKSEMAKTRYAANGGSFHRLESKEATKEEEVKGQDMPHFMEAIVAKTKKKPRRRRKKSSKNT